MESRIPIENIYYLLIYAWDRLEEGAVVDISGVDSTRLVDLYAAVLLNGLQHLLRRGLDRAYLPIEEEIAGVRGRIQISATVRRMLIQHGRVACEYDELSVDTLPNRILLATVRRLIRTADLDEKLRGQLHALSRSLSAIHDILLNKQVFRTVQLHSNNGFYRFLLNLCELVLDSMLATEDTGQYRFRDFLRDPAKMPRLFEKFILNFYRRECPQADVRSERIYWKATSYDDPDLHWLPSMQTDISLRMPGRTLIIDAKFYEEALQRHFQTETVHSSNLYQLFSYLKNLEPRGGQDASAEGMLLYPVVDKRIRLKYEIRGHTIRICTLDLAKPWRVIRQELLELARN